MPDATPEICLGEAVGRRVAQAAPLQPEGYGRGHLAGGLRRHAPRGTRGARHPAAAAHVDLERVVQSGRCARHRDSVLSRPSPPDEAREEDDVRRRGRNLARMHGHPPSRSGPRHTAWLPVAAPPALAATVRPVVETLSALLPAQSGEPALCPASAALVRAERSGRGFRRDVCGVAAAALELADAICWLAGTEEA